MTPIRTSMDARDWGVLLLLSFIWGGSFFFAKVAVAEIPPITIVWARVALAALALGTLLALWRQGLPKGWPLWRLFVLMGIVNNVIPFTLIFWAQTEIASALAAILNATTPLFTVIVAHVFTTDERLNAGKLVGIALGMAGVAVMIGPGALAGLDRTVVAELACLAACLSYAFAGMVGRRFREFGITPVQTAFGPLTASSIMMLPLVVLVDAPWRLPTPSAASMGAIVLLALVSTAFAYVLFFRLIGRVGATNVALVTFLIPPSAILLGVGLLGERLTMGHVTGMVLVALGLVAIDGRLAGRVWGNGQRPAAATPAKADTTRS